MEAAVILWAMLMLLVGWIVWSNRKEKEADSAASGLHIDPMMARWLRTISCSIPLTEQEAAARLSDGVPAGELVCKWDAERGAYCFRSELPDGNAPMYFAARFAPCDGGLRLTLTRLSGLERGRPGCIMWMPGYLKAKLGATQFSYTMDEHAVREGRV